MRAPVLPSLPSNLGSSVEAVEAGCGAIHNKTGAGGTSNWTFAHEVCCLVLQGSIINILQCSDATNIGTLGYQSISKTSHLF